MAQLVGRHDCSGTPKLDNLERHVRPSDFAALKTDSTTSWELNSCSTPGPMIVCGRRATRRTMEALRSVARRRTMHM
jgi:hypothetical protein